jgi:glycosyltransferase involved in cell wall biosynthesis
MKAFMVEPLFSVLIANYNNGRYIQAAIESVLCQSYQHFEIIIVDDGSTDGSINVINTMAKTDSRIRVFRNRKNRGVGYTKRRCIQHCHGELFAFLDPDDALEQDALKLMVEAHLSNPLASIIYSKHYICDKDLNVLKIFDKSAPIPVGKTYLHATASDYYHITHFVSFKKKYYNLTEGLNPVFKKAADKDLYYKMEEVGAVFFLDKILYYYRHHEGSISLYDNKIMALSWEIKAKELAFERRKNCITCINITKKDLSDLRYIFFNLQIEHYQTKKYILKLFSYSILFFINYPSIQSLKRIYSLFLKYHHG